MSPICQQMSREPTRRNASQASVAEEAVPEAESPLPSPTPPATPSPPPLVSSPLPFMIAGHQENLKDEQQENAEYGRLNAYSLLQDAVSHCLPIDHNLPQMLRRVTGHSNLRSVRELRLRIISREMSLQRLALFTPNLREINLDGSSLNSLRDLGCALYNLQVLRVARCGLESLDGVLGLGSLRELHASENHIDDITPCSSLLNIRIVDLRKNTLSDLTYLQFLDVCTFLHDLTLEECPAASRPGYRATVRSLLPNLAYLDGIPVSQNSTQSCSGGSQDNACNAENSNTKSRLQDHEEIGEYSLWALQPELPQQPIVPREKSDVIVCSAEGASGSSSPEMATTAEKQVPSFGAIRKRPLSSASVWRATKSSSSLSTQRKPRPMSASATESGARCGSPSALTSGMVVCGNLTAALRSRRKHCEAWTSESLDSNLQVRGAESSNTQDLTTGAGECPGSAQSSPSALQEPEEDLLEKSSKWRLQYKLYRAENRDRWEKEEEEHSEKKAASEQPVEVGSVTAKASASGANKRSTKQTTCCPHLFALKKPTESLSSTEGENNSKRFSRFTPQC